MKKLVLTMGMIFLIFPLWSQSAEWEEELIHADLSEMMDKLDEASEEADRLMDEIEITLAFAKKMRAKERLNKKERAVFYLLSKKYELPRLKIKAILRKRIWGEKDRRFLFAQIPRIIGHQREHMKHHVLIRMMADTKLRGDRRFDFDTPRVRRAAEKIGKNIVAYKEVVYELVVYEKRLREEVGEGV